jgi:DNA-binding transcriptional regulator YiaG
MGHGPTISRGTKMHDASRTSMTGHDLRQWRTEHGMSQTQLAALLDVPSNTLAQWERGTLGIRHPRILALALDRLSAANLKPGRTRTRPSRS